MTTTAISSADIALYRRFDGDIDGLSRSAARDVHASDAAWRTIDDLRQRAFIVAAGHASEVFAQRFEADLVAHISDVKVRSQFRQLVEADLSASTHRAGG
ncbi:MAG: hypothetical protein R3E86_08835 [Pseudomonadales bacterium]